MNHKEKLLIAKGAKLDDPIFLSLAESLAEIEELKFVKIFADRIVASNYLSEHGKKQPITTIGKNGVVGVELLVSPLSKVVQFFSITSTSKGAGSKIVSSVLSATPNSWAVVVLMDWSEGFWSVMKTRHPRLKFS